MYLHIASTAPKRAAMTTALVDPTMMKVVVSERTRITESATAAWDRRQAGKQAHTEGGGKERQTDR